jgi:hypothetical protein
MSHPREILGKDVWSIVMDYMNDMVEVNSSRYEALYFIREKEVHENLKEWAHCWNCHRFRYIDRKINDPCARCIFEYTGEQWEKTVKKMKREWLNRLVNFVFMLYALWVLAHR